MQLSTPWVQSPKLQINSIVNLKTTRTELYANKLENLDKKYKYLEEHKVVKLVEEEAENLKRLITR